MNLNVQKLHLDAITPTYATPGAACFDLHSIEDAKVLPGGAATVDTGLAFEVPNGYAMMVYSRSGHGFKNAVRLANCTGVIDSDYRGPLLIRLVCDSGLGLRIQKGERVAQAMLVPVQTHTFTVIDKLTDTARGSGGLGSTGV